MHSERGLQGGSTLPIEEVAGEIVSRLSAERTLVLVAETGSGKTTKVPQIMLKSGMGERGKIVVLQPRRLAARAVARRVAHELGESEGGTVGYRTRYERVESERTRILFMTDGLFVRLAQGNPNLDGIGAVILDEFHERGISSDLAAGWVRRLRERRREDLRVVLMSATLDAARLAEFFGVKPIVVPGRLYPIDIRYAGERSGVDVVGRAAAAVAEAMGDPREDLGDALVFMPGRREIQMTIEALEMRIPRGQFDLLALHGGQTPQEQDRALGSSQKRKIVVATNIAETSLTISGVRLVVDSGLARVHRFDPLRDLNALKLEPISQASARQRAGRAGRTGPGACVRLWSESSHGRRPEFDSPEIHRIDLSESFLSLAALGERDPMQFPWIDPPRESARDRACRVLVACGAFDESLKLTPTGQSMSQIPAHPRLARALLEGAHRGCADRASLWAALLSERDPFDRVNSEAMRAILEADDHPSDMIARERALNAGRGSRRQFSAIDNDAAREVLRSAEQLERAARRVGAKPSGAAAGALASNLASTEALCESFMLGFPDRIAWKGDRNRPHASMAGRRKVSIDRRSMHEGSGPLLAFEVRETGGGDTVDTTLSMTAALEQGWVESTLPHRFTSRIEERWEPSSQSVEEVEERLFDATVIERTVRPPRNLTDAALLIASKMIEDGLRTDDWVDQSLTWITRVRWVAEQFPDRALLAYTDDDLRVLLAEVAAGATRWSQVRSRPSLEVVLSALSYEDQTFVERMAPASIRLPTGFRMKLEYEIGQPPVGRAKIQDLYGLDASPRVADGRTAIRLEILGPNRRPLQITSDLAGFWRGLYPEIRNEMRRRYPRHEWR